MNDDFFKIFLSTLITAQEWPNDFVKIVDGKNDTKKSQDEKSKV